MTIKDIMTDPAIVVTADDTLYHAARVMREHNIGSVPVVDDAGDAVGIVTDRDLVIRAVARGLEPKETRVSQIMTGQVRVVSADTDIEEAADLMSRDQVRRIPVVENGRVVGIVALGDLALCRDYRIECADTLCEISRS